MRRPLATLILAIAAITSASATASAQKNPSNRFMENCERNSGDNERFCEQRNFTLPATQGLTVDGRANGGITVHGWDKPSIQVVAMIQASARSEADAQALARQVNVLTNGAEIRSEGPSTRGGGESWSVSYEIWAPRHTALSLASTNGGIAVDAIDAKMDLETVNGGLELVDVDGDVRGTTTNGGITARLSGERWRGAGLDVKTSNGGVHLYLPGNYSANLETGTTNGSLNLGFPVTVQGTVGRHISTQIGGGGATIRAMTTNGGVSISRS